MATKRFLGQAGATIQIDSIALGGTFVAGDQVSVQIGHSTLAVILGIGQTTPAFVATVIKNAINARSVDEAIQSTETRLNAGQLLGEFRDVNAIIDPASSDNVLVRSNIAGVPFGTPNGGGPINPTVVATTSSGGTIALTSIQAATGPWHWDNADNWDAGTVPATGDTAQFAGINISVKYGLPNDSLRVTLDIPKSYAGDIGLPEINTMNAGSSYYEYRQRYVRLDNPDTYLFTMHHVVGYGAGNGSQLINVRHKDATCGVTVFGTGTPKVDGGKALNICCTNIASTLQILGGSVDWGSQDSSTAAWNSVQQSDGDSRGAAGLYTTAAALVSGGTMLISGTGGFTFATCNGGTMRLENQSGTIGTCTGTDGTIQFPSNGTITTLTLSGGTFDARGGAGGFTVTNASIYEGSKFLDPAHRCVMTNAFKVYYDVSADLQFGANAASYATIHN